MSLLDHLITSTDEAWAALRSLLVPVYYIRITPGPYTPSLGTINQTTTKTRIMVGMIDYTDGTRANSDMEAGDRRAIIRASDLTVRPSHGDLLVEANNITWSVVRVSGDPRLFWDLQVRR